MTNKTEESKLFEEFPPISTQDWEEKIKKDLKGADYEKKLVWRTIEGFNVKPYYRSEDLENLKHLNYLPGEFPYVRGNKTNNNKWYVRQDISVNDDIKLANTIAIEILTKGVDSIAFVIKDKKELSFNDISILLKDIDLNKTEINFVGAQHAQTIINYIKENNLSNISGSVDFDPLAKLISTGNFCSSSDEVLKLSNEILQSSKDFQNFKTIGVNGELFNHAGASIVQELAFSLSMGNHYLSELSSNKIDEIASKIKFTFGVGSNYFLEIAKFRAARMLWAKIVEAYKPENIEATKMYIHAVTSQWNQTIYDPYVNMLRGTSESMSAAIAGVDSLSVTPFNTSFEETTKFSERIARNTQIILKEESYFDKIVDPAGGSYYIENLTNSIAENAWNLFKEIENKDGFTAAFKEGFIQDEIKKITNKRNLNIATGKEAILGTNKYPNGLEKMDKEFGIKTILTNTKKDDNAIAEPLNLYRGSQELELLRLKTDRNEKKPKVFLFNIGNLTMRKARAGFASGFFACAGFDIIDNIGFDTIDEGVNEATKNKADIVVICSSDPEYAELAPEIYNKLNKDAIIVIAGYPKDIIDDLKAAGIKHFIHVKSNLLETLGGFQKELGIE
ncbi:MAG: methylmalonyl-CoA mutase family protein [Bacteroidota bacterium]|nr:methylmalonyl-CoA mutase family protein [Bacteroidota bacterium]